MSDGPAAQGLEPPSTRRSVVPVRHIGTWSSAPHYTLQYPVHEARGACIKWVVCA